MWNGVRSGAILLLTLALPAPPQAGTTPKVQTCAIAADVLKCPRFGLTYKIPFGWVDRTSDMQNSDMQNQDASETPAKSETLLAIFERPPGVSGDTINSAVVVAAESLTNYHGVKQPADYFGPITELAEQRGFKVVNEPYTVSVGAKRLVRGDFSKNRGKLTMWQTSLVMIEKGYIVSCTFAAGSEEELDDLIRNLNFTSTSPKPPSTKP
jgi:hypothetical protein